jgi:hypothetical protein
MVTTHLVAGMGVIFEVLRMIMIPGACDRRVVKERVHALAKVCG